MQEFQKRFIKFLSDPNAKINIIKIRNSGKAETITKSLYPIKGFDYNYIIVDESVTEDQLKDLKNE